MSAIRLFILGTLAASGPLHGHQIRQQAQADRTDKYAEIQVGSLYGALKRMAREGLVRETRTERVGNRPERTVYEITPEGRQALSVIRDEALHKIRLPHDPFDLALKQARDMAEEDLAQVVADRLATLRAKELSWRHQAERADQYLNEAERMLGRHLVDRVAAEVRWHEELLNRIPKIAADFREGIGAPVTPAKQRGDGLEPREGGSAAPAGAHR
ncbi:MAG TPA: PadR family transcriptional regulator [Streptosporangiaceae bacterium]|nr:PadR family transcriptional regulator [Streptosporangiaceae bacterium]